MSVQDRCGATFICWIPGAPNLRGFPVAFLTQRHCRDIAETAGGARQYSLIATSPKNGCFLGHEFDPYPSRTILQAAWSTHPLSRTCPPV